MLEAGFNVVDRSETELLLREQGVYGQSGIIDPSTAPMIGKILGVQALLTGTVSEYASNVGEVQGTQMAFSNVTLSIKMIDVQTAEVIWSGMCKGQVPFQAGQQMLAAKRAIKNIIKKLPLEK